MQNGDWVLRQEHECFLDILIGFYLVGEDIEEVVAIDSVEKEVLNL